MPGPQVRGKKGVDNPIYRAYNATIESDRPPRANGNEPHEPHRTNGAQRTLETEYAHAVQRTVTESVKTRATTITILRGKNYDN